MIVLLVLLALAMVATGGAAIAFGVPIVQVERGWTMVISGSVLSSAGFVLLGVALAAAKLAQIANELSLIRDRSGPYDGPFDEPALTAPARQAALPTPVETPVAPAPGPPPPADIMQATPAPSDVIVGQYASGGNSYVMFEDGSIQADTPEGRRRFGSLEELRTFVAAGGERASGR